MRSTGRDASGEAATRALHILRAIVSETTTAADEPSDGPPEEVVADADQEWFADRAERRDERAFWGAA